MEFSPKGDRFEGWETYPRNLKLPLWAGDAYQQHEKLTNDAERLFIPQNEKCRLGMLNLANMIQMDDPFMDPITIETSEQLAKQLQKPQPSWVFLIPQAYSWGPLLLPESLFRQLLTAFNINPRFLSVVHVFGQRVSPVEESFASFFTRLSPALSNSTLNSYQITYNIKYVARHGRDMPRDPFSIRQTGIYQQFNADSDKCTWIVLQPSDELEEQLGPAFMNAETTQPAGQFRCHALILLCLVENWRDYVSYLEESLAALLDHGFFTDPTTDFEDIRKLQIMMDRLIKLIHLLGLNLSVCAQLKLFLAEAKSKLSSGPLITLLDQGSALVENAHFQWSTHRSQLTTLMKRGEGAVAMIENILSFRSTENAHNLNSAMHEMSKHAAEENKLVRQLTLQSVRDTRFMKIVAIITSIFLPATFVATFFGSNFFGFEETKGEKRLKVASNIWIYVVIVFVCSGITLAMWYWWWSRDRSGVSTKRNSEV